jgi:hypothetical protein
MRGTGPRRPADSRGMFAEGGVRPGGRRDAPRRRGPWGPHGSADRIGPARRRAGRAFRAARPFAIRGGIPWNSSTAIRPNPPGRTAPGRDTPPVGRMSRRAAPPPGTRQGAEGRIPKPSSWRPGRASPGLARPSPATPRRRAATPAASSRAATPWRPDDRGRTPTGRAPSTATAWIGKRPATRFPSATSCPPRPSPPPAPTARPVPDACAGEPRWTPAPAPHPWAAPTHREKIAGAGPPPSRRRAPTTTIPRRPPGRRKGPHGPAPPPSPWDAGGASTSRVRFLQGQGLAHPQPGR